MIASSGQHSGSAIATAAERFVDANRAALIDLCAELVAAASVNPPGDVRAPARVLAGFLESRGIDVERAAAYEDKPNLVASVEGRAPGRHLVLNGHLDTVPPGDEDAWTVPVYELARMNGRLTGLGIGNMKAGVAALALAAVFLAERRGAWPGRLSLTAVADETDPTAHVAATGSAGTLAAGDALKERHGSRIAAVEALECPTMLNKATASTTFRASATSTSR